MGITIAFCVGLSALLVSTDWAMREPLHCGTGDRTGSTFFMFYDEITLEKRIRSLWEPGRKNTGGGTKYHTFSCTLLRCVAQRAVGKWRHRFFVPITAQFDC